MALRAAALAAAMLVGTGCAGIPETGQGRSDVDRHVRKFMTRWNVPGLTLAVVADGRLVLARGYGFADPANEEPVRPDGLFRIASATKPVTAAAVMKLVESGRLELDESVFVSLLPGYPRRCDGVDPGLRQITVRQLLAHRSGWDTSAAGDPLFNAALIASRVDRPDVRRVESVIQYMVCRPLAFPPGSKHVYENLNYAVLGRVIEAVSGMTYERFVRERIFGPLDITAPRVGGSLQEERLPGEVVYLASGKDRRRVAPALGPRTSRVPLHYGGFDLEAMDSHGGWVASAIDLVRFMAGVDGRPGIPDVLGPTTLDRMGARPGGEDAQGDVWYGLGWYRTASGAWIHDGSLPGSSAYLRMEPDGVLYAALANTRYPSASFMDSLGSAIRAAVASVEHWPAHDLFPDYGFPASSGRPGADH